MYYNERMNVCIYCSYWVWHTKKALELELCVYWRVQLLLLLLLSFIRSQSLNMEYETPALVLEYGKCLSYILVLGAFSISIEWIKRKKTLAPNSSSFCESYNFNAFECIIYPSTFLLSILEVPFFSTENRNEMRMN